MNKTELIEVVAASSHVPKASVGKVLDAVMDAVMDNVAKGDTVSLIGFGSFEPRKRAARAGKNPQTGAAIKIVATTVTAFKPGKGFKDKVAAKKPPKGKK